MIAAVAVAALVVADDGAGENYLQAEMHTLMLPGMSLAMEVIPCGSINAAYFPPAHTIFVCRELLVLPKPVIRFVLAHEMGHAIIDQLDIPIAGSEEAAADELAAVALEAIGDQDAVYSGALWMEQQDVKEDVWDDHQSSRKRAAVIMCLADGAESVPVLAECGGKFHHAQVTWSHLIMWRLAAMGF